MAATATEMTATARARESLPIADYGLLADCNTAALVSRDGSIDWLCLPRYDAPHELARSVEGIAGEVELVFELAPRPEYGLVRPLFRKEADGGRTFGGPNQITVRTGAPLAVEGS